MITTKKEVAERSDTRLRMMCSSVSFSLIISWSSLSSHDLCAYPLTPPLIAAIIHLSPHGGGGWRRFCVKAEKLFRHFTDKTVFEKGWRIIYVFVVWIRKLHKGQGHLSGIVVKFDSFDLDSKQGASPFRLNSKYLGPFSKLRFLRVNYSRLRSSFLRSFLSRVNLLGYVFLWPQMF